MKRIILLLCYIALTISDPSKQSSQSVIANYAKSLCDQNLILKQGTYECVEKSNIDFIPKSPISDVRYNLKSILPVCEITSQFYDKERQKCVPECDPPKIKNFINGSCETKESLLETLPEQAIYSFDGLSVFSEGLMSQIKYENIDYFRQNCPLIDLKTRRCMQTIRECTGFVINKMYCKQCDCDNEINENDELCLRKCSCKHLFYQQLQIDDRSDSAENPTENTFVCKTECQKDFESGLSKEKTSNFVQFGKLCIRENKCPYLVLNEQICSKTCPSLQKKFIHYNEKNERCLQCQRIEKNGLCSDVCSNFNEMLFLEQNTFDVKCQDRHNYPELALINNHGCLFPLVLSVDGSQCLRECPSGQKHVHIKNSILSKCIQSDECEPGYFESSNGKECVDICDKLLEEESKGSNKCQKCIYCDRKKSLNEQVKNLERILKLFHDNEVIHYIDRIGEKIQRIFHLIRKLPTNTKKNRYLKYQFLRDYLQTTIVYHHQRLFLLGQRERSFYFDIKQKFGYGIEEIQDQNQQYSFEIIKGTISSVKFQINLFLGPSHQIKQQIAQFDNIIVCFQHKFCKQATLFYNLNIEIYLMPIFQVQSEVIDDLYCVYEEFLTLSFWKFYQSNLSPAKRINETEVRCNRSFNRGGVGLVTLSKKEISEYKGTKTIDQETGKEHITINFLGLVL